MDGVGRFGWVTDLRATESNCGSPPDRDLQGSGDLLVELGGPFRRESAADLSGSWV